MAESKERSIWICSTASNKHLVSSIRLDLLPHDLSLDITKKKLYWRVANDEVFSCDYHAQNRILTTSRNSPKYLGSFIYMMERKDVISIRNVTDLRLIRKFSVPPNISYHGFALVSRSIQESKGKLQNFYFCFYLNF